MRNEGGGWVGTGLGWDAGEAASDGMGWGGDVESRDSAVVGVWLLLGVGCGGCGQVCGFVESMCLGDVPGKGFQGFGFCEEMTNA